MAGSSSAGSPPGSPDDDPVSVGSADTDPGVSGQDAGCGTATNNGGGGQPAEGT